MSRSVPLSVYVCLSLSVCVYVWLFYLGVCISLLICVCLCLRVSLSVWHYVSMIAVVFVRECVWVCVFVCVTVCVPDCLCLCSCGCVCVSMSVCLSVCVSVCVSCHGIVFAWTTSLCERSDVLQWMDYPYFPPDHWEIRQNLMFNYLADTSDFDPIKIFLDGFSR